MKRLVYGKMCHRQGFIMIDYGEKEQKNTLKEQENGMYNIIIDTSILIDHLRGISRDFRLLETKKATESVSLLIPHIVIVELFTGEEARKKDIRKKIDKLIEGLEVIGLTVSSAKKAGDLQRTYKQIPDLPDLIIAAIALEQEAQIATHNKKHFGQIKRVKLYDFSASIKQPS